MTLAVITGLGAVSAVGRGTARLWSAMSEGRDGIAPIRRFDPTGYGVALAGMVPERNTPAHAATPTWQHCIELALEAAGEALAVAAPVGVAPERIALVLGSSLGDPAMPIHEMTRRVGDALGVAGPRLTVSTACTSSTNAIGLALELLRLDAADVVIAGGSDVLTPLVLAGFTTLGVLSAGKCAPFSEPPGTSLGEGAGFVVIERREAARRRGAAAPLAVLGYGLSADGFHDTGPDPSGGGVARAIQAALDHAGVAPAEVDYVNAHGTGTRANDPAEWRALQTVFGAHAETLPVSSSKSFLGHAQGAAGALETIATLVALEHGAIPPTQRFTVARPHSPRDPVGQATARAARCRIAVCTNSAFGGANCAVVVGDAGRAAAVVTPRRIYIGGLGAVGPHGTALAQVRGGSGGGRVPGFALEDVLPSADPRGLDASTRFLTAAAALALTDAGVRVRAGARERTGLIVGITVASPEAETDLMSTIDRHGYAGLSASKFSRMVLNAPAGTCCKLIGLRGAHSTVSAGTATGLFAVAYAAELLATRRDCDRLLAVGVDELPAAAADGASEGAACVLLSATPSPVAVTGWSVAGPGRLAVAVAAALVMAGPGEVDVVIGPAMPNGFAATQLDPAAFAGDSLGYTPALGVVLAAMLVRSGLARRVLVTARGDGAADCALVIDREEPVHAS